MPDRDVFNLNVCRRWQRAARLTLADDLSLPALQSVVRALAKDLKENGCPGFVEAIDIVTDAVQMNDLDEARGVAHRRLDHIRRREGSGHTETMVDACKGLLVVSKEACLAPSANVDRSIMIAVHVIARIADALMCPARLLVEIVENGQVAFQIVRVRREQMIRALVETPATAEIAKQLLVDSSGSAVRTPRLPRIAQSQADILVMQLTD